ncbi:MAG: BamA/TamA family outer membrane protein, partial [Candidatus Krumholzibacteriota bacterium]|nr:BamA/TamA family outer membrane protein [Candidatus Krumholzibacteriota bacterium]
EWDDEWDDDHGGRGRFYPRRRGGRIEFRFADADYERVLLEGDFNDWLGDRMDFDEQGEVWSLRVDLDPGRHHYRFRVEAGRDDWKAIDPSNPDARKLRGRGWVSILDLSENRRPRRPRWESLRRARREFERSNEFHEVFVGYQRVDGWTLGLVPSFLTGRGFEPSAWGRVSYGLKSERWSGGVTVLQPLLAGNRLWLRLDGFAGTDFTDQTGISDPENSLAAILFREDYRDYHRREGVTASLVFGAWRWLRLEGGARSDDFTSLERTVNWSLHSGVFRPNPPVDEGSLRAVFGNARLGTRFSYLELAYERCGDDVMEGDFDYERLAGTLRGRLRLGRRQHLDVRLAGGGALTGALPVQRQFVVGGLGTVRGYDYQSLLVPAASGGAAAPYGGQKMVLANAEYTFAIDRDFDVFLFYDAGMAWEDRKADVELDQLKGGAGLGVEIEDAGLRVTIAKALDGSERDPVVAVRLQRMF